MSKPILISGIQPTGRLHLGNYLGALKNFVDLQNSGKYECYFFIADLHALTENPDAEDLRKNIIGLAADFLAAGLNPEKSTVYQQSKIEEVQELKWILSTLAPLSELMRMTAFKEKVLQPLTPDERKKITKERFEEIVEGTNFGLAEYPLLMTADILILDGKLVPVGEDQLQHLEFARTLVRKFNSKFGKTFTEPQPILSKTPRLMSLDDPSKKMSKSRPAGCLFLDDSPKEIEQKIKSAVTDSGNEVKYDPQNKAAISNLMTIYSELSPSRHSERREESLKAIEKQFAGKDYAEFKKSLAETVIKYFEPFRKEKAKLMKKPAAIAEVLEAGSIQAHEIAKKKMLEVKKKVGLIG